MWEQIKKMFGTEEETIITDEYRSIMDDFESGKNILVLGRAGTGKTKLIEHIRAKSQKTIAVLAPTGLAAINVRGQTLHSFFKLPPQLLTPETIARLRGVPDVLRQLDAVIIDEISMVRADVLDAIDVLMRKYGKDKRLAFGGVQMLLVGDVFQLPPVVTNDERAAFERMYELPYFFGSNVFMQADFERRELTQVFRQTDRAFIEALHRIRTADPSQEDMELINSRVVRERPRGHVLLATTNRVVEAINLAELAQLTGKERVYTASFSGLFPTEERALPVDDQLRLKVGARVVMIKNGPLWANGSVGTVAAMRDTGIAVKLDSRSEVVEVEPETWQNIVYKLNEDTGKLEEKITGSMQQLPVRLAWAVTIHKSQGMSLDAMHIDFSKSPFAHGQTYVALSRCRTVQGISLSRPLYPNDLIVDPRVVEFVSGKSADEHWW